MTSQPLKLKKWVGTGWDWCRIISSQYDTERHGSEAFPHEEGSRKRPDGWREQLVHLCWSGVHFLVRYDSVYAVKLCDRSCGDAQIENFRTFFRPIQDSIRAARVEAKDRLQIPSRDSLTKLRTPAEGLLYDPVRLSFAGEPSAQSTVHDPALGVRSWIVILLGFALLLIIAWYRLHR